MQFDDLQESLKSRGISKENRGPYTNKAATGKNVLKCSAPRHCLSTIVLIAELIKKGMIP